MRCGFLVAAACALGDYGKYVAVLKCSLPVKSKRCFAKAGHTVSLEENLAL